jgi:uncharacterized protein involved in type VI secretion and phage assembly
MPTQPNLITHLLVKVGGSPLPRPMMDSLISVEVDDSLNLPDMFTIHLRDPQLEWTEGSLLALGAPVELSVETESGTEKLMSGEITGLEPTFLRDAGPTLLVRGYDLSHRLHHSRKTRSFVQKTDSDIAAQVAREGGLRSRIEPTSEVYEWVLQNNQTDLELLQERARRIGYRVYVEEQRLHFVPAPEQAGQTPTLDYGGQLHEFRARIVTTEQVSEVTVRGWDPRRKRGIIGRATRPQGLPQIGQSTEGGRAAERAFGSAGKQIVVDRPVTTQAEADALAQAVCNDVGATFVQAEGTCFGNAAVLAGATINLTGLGSKFSGQYLVTNSRHRYDRHGYTTEFTVSGQRPTTITQLLAPKDGKATVRSGVVVGIVTDNKDPDNWGRVKVQYPWQDDSIVSSWARIATPMAGASRGFEFLPEINDEVLLAFEHGDMHRPYVLGALWNGTDLPPEQSSEVVGSTGKVNRRIIKSRIGHTIILDDTNDAGGITIEDKTGKNRIKIDTQGKKLIIEADGDIEIKASRNITIEGRKVSVNGQTSVDIKGAKVNLN